MFKRANKITSLLVTAAAVMSLVPAYAADVKKIDSQDGTVYNAVAYKDGTFYVDGEVNDKDEAAYYVKDGKYTALADVDSGDTTALYGNKYLEVSSGDYYLDLTTGKVTDDSIADDTKDDAASALRKKLNKDDPDSRYLATDYDTLKDKTMAIVPNNKFGETWYEQAFKTAAGKTANASAPDFMVYTDVNGNYIDADYNLGKINAITSAGAVDLKNTNDDDNGSRASIRHIQTIGSDKDYIYRLAALTVVDKNGAKVSKFGSSSDSVTVTTGGAITVIQKISKAQDSGDVDDAKYAKTTATYFLTGDDGAVKSAYANWTVADGKLVNYEVRSGKIYAQAITLKSKAGYYYTDISDGDNADVTDYSTDVNGNLWVLDGGYIKQFNNDDSIDKVYKVDGSFDKLSAYDKNNMVAWNEDDEVYSLIGGKTTTDTTTTPAVTAGWAKATDGTWTFVKADGTKATGWYQDGATWYYLGATGTMATGWQNVGGTWYYLAGSGAMVTGWFTDATGTWYYTNASGAMLSNTVVDGYKLGASGAWVK